MFSVCGYLIIDVFAKAAQMAGVSLNTNRFIKIMDTMGIDSDWFGSPKTTCIATKRLGNDLSRLSQIRRPLKRGVCVHQGLNVRWKVR